MTRTTRSSFVTRLAGLGVVAALVAVACAESSTGTQEPVPGEITVRWTTPHADDRAAVLRLVLPEGMSTAAIEIATPGLEVFHRRTADTLRIAVFGALGSQGLARFSVPDVRQASRVVATVVEVSDANDALRESLAGYSVIVERP